MRKMFVTAAMAIMVCLTGRTSYAANPGATTPAPSASATDGRRVADAEALIKLAAAEVKLAEREFDSARSIPLQLEARLVHLRARRGDLRAPLEFVDRALKQFDNPVKRQSESALMLARAYSILGDRAQADKALADFIAAAQPAKAPEDDDNLISVAHIHAINGRFDEASKMVARMKLLRRQVAACSQLAIMAFNVGRPDEFQRLVRESESAVEREPEKVFDGRDEREREYLKPVFARLKCDDRNGARDRAMRLKDPRNRVEALIAVAEADLKAGDRQHYAKGVGDAIETSGSIKAQELGFMYLMILSRMQIEGGDKEGALATIRRAEEIIPPRGDASDAALKLAEAYASAGDVKKADAMATKAITAPKPRDPGTGVRIQLRVAIIYAAANDLPAAESVLKQIPKIPGWNPTTELEETDRKIVSHLLAAGNIKEADRYAAGMKGFNAASVRRQVAKIAAEAGDLSIVLRLFESEKTPQMASVLATALARSGRAGEIAAKVRGLSASTRTEAYVAGAEELLKGQPANPTLRPLPQLPRDLLAPTDSGRW